MLKKLGIFALGVLAAASLSVWAQVQLLDVDILGALDITSDSPQLFITETDAAADNGIWLQRAVAEQFIFEACTDALSCVDIMQVDRTGSTVDTVNLLPAALQMNGIDLTVETGTFEIEWETACTTTPSQTWDYIKNGNMVTILMVDAVSCTSDSTGFTSTDADIPTSIRPAQTAIVGIMGVTDNATGSPGCMVIPITGIPAMRRETGGTSPCFATAWTASSTKAISNVNGANSFTYMLNNP